MCVGGVGGGNGGKGGWRARARACVCVGVCGGIPFLFNILLFERVYARMLGNHNSVVYVFFFFLFCFFFNFLIHCIDCFQILRRDWAKHPSSSALFDMCRHTFNGSIFVFGWNCRRDSLAT